MQIARQRIGLPSTSAEQEEYVMPSSGQAPDDEVEVMQVAPPYQQELDINDIDEPEIIDGAEADSDNFQEYFENPDEEFDLREIVRRYCIKHKPTYRGVADLLKIFNGKPCNATPQLPKSYVTLMRTPRDQIKAKYISPGQYYHFGLEQVSNELDKMIQSNDGNVRCKLSIHVDGVALSDSSKLGAWAIAGSLDNFPNLTPFLIGVYVGYGQPEDFDLFLEDLAKDLHIGHTTGFMVSEKFYFYNLQYIVADAPARSKIAHILGHGSLKGCPFCSQIGYKNANIGTQYASEIVLPLRTDESFRLRNDENHFQKSHRKQMGVLESIGVPMITKMAPCAMHSFDHGTMKKIMKIIFEKKGFRGHMKLSTEGTHEISRRYLSLKEHHPLDFTRKIRSLQDNFNLLKAAEYRYILLYYGFLIFKNIFTEEMYQHFLCLSMGARLLCDLNPTKEGLDMAQTLIEKFVKDFSIYYGTERTYVVHTLLHFKTYVEMYGPLYDFSSYRFENYYRIFKGLVRAKHHVLQQIRNRISETGLLRIREDKNDGLQLRSFVQHINGVDECSEYIKSETTFRTDNANCFAMIKIPNQIPFVCKILKFKRYEGGNVNFEFKKIKKIGSFFKINFLDLESTDFDIFICEPNEESTVYEASIDIISYKLISTPLYWVNNVRVMQRLIHSTG